MDVVVRREEDGCGEEEGGGGMWWGGVFQFLGILLGLAATGLCIDQDIFAYKWLLL